MSYFSECPVTIAFDHSGHTHIVWCGKWNCLRCQKRLAHQWAQRARLARNPSGSLSGSNLFFLTLTLGGNAKTATEGFSAIPSLWDTTRKAYQRFYGTFSYLAFVEGQPRRSGMPHFHILTWNQVPVEPNRRGRVTKHALHNWAHALGWGFQAVCEVVTSGLAAVYVAKYATKQSSFTPKHFRRVRCSQDWPKPDRGKLPAWLVPQRGESAVDFILRVSDFTGIPSDDLYPRYLDGQNELVQLRQKITS